MLKNLGILCVFLAVFGLTAVLSDDTFLGAYNLQNLLRRASGFAILGIGMMFVIVTGGIDLSIGSLICLNACILQWLLIQQGVPPMTGLLAILLLSTIIGYFHGLLITKASLQPFVVTLCGLLIYRGLARWMTGDQNVGWGDTIPGLRKISTEGLALPGLDFVLPWQFIVMLAIGLLSALFLHKTIYGRYLLALGRNEQAARYSGINTDKMIILSYVICAVISGIGGTMIALYQSLVQPTAIGTFYELYAIAACVLGRCSLRGGQGYVFGVIMGAALLPLIRNSISFLGIGDQLEFGVIGVVILIGVIFDEGVRRIATMKREGVSFWPWLGKNFVSGEFWQPILKATYVAGAVVFVGSLVWLAENKIATSSSQAHLDELQAKISATEKSLEAPDADRRELNTVLRKTKSEFNRATKRHDLRVASEPDVATSCFWILATSAAAAAAGFILERLTQKSNR